jgi:diaminopimelate epimerase
VNGVSMPVAGLSFVKLEATGNDFVVVDEHGAEPALPVPVRMALCARHTGVGGDGVLTILPARAEVAAMGGRYRMHITNPDGSVPEMCGNGLRCVARHLAETGRIDVDTDVVIDTDAGPRTVVVARDFGSVTINMGRADLDSRRQFPVRFDRAALDNAGVDGMPATSVSMGNPHVVLETTSLPDLVTAARVGPALEFDRQRFPERTNVEWVVERPDGDLDVLVWERGAGLTQACGTGACAVTAALVRHGRRAAGTTVCHLPGGPLRITVTGLDAPIFMEGPVRRVFAGVWSG